MDVSCYCIVPSPADGEEHTAMTTDASSSELEARGLVRSELEPLRATLDEFREGFLDDLHAMERRLIRTMVGTMLGGVLTIALIAVAVSA